MTTPISLDSVRSEHDTYAAILRRLDVNFQDPSWVENVIKENKARADLLGRVDLGSTLRYALLTFGVHRVWTIVDTEEMPSGCVTIAFVESVVSRDLSMGPNFSMGLSMRRVFPQNIENIEFFPVLPHAIKDVMIAEFPLTKNLPLKDMDMLATMRVFAYLVNNKIEPTDELGVQRAYTQAMEIRERIRRCFARHPSLWKEDPIRE